MIKYGTCDRCGAVCETLHQSRGQWVCNRHEQGSAAVWLLAAPLVVMVVMFAAQLAGRVAGVA